MPRRAICAGVRRDAGKGHAALRTAIGSFWSYNGEAFQVARVNDWRYWANDAAAPGHCALADRTRRKRGADCRCGDRTGVSSGRSRADENPACGDANCVGGGPSQRRDPRWRNHCLSPGGTTVHRQADRPAGELCRPGGDRDGERAADHRAARGAGTADRDRGRVAGDQCLARRTRPRVRRYRRKGHQAMRRRGRRVDASRWGSVQSGRTRWRARGLR